MERLMIAAEGLDFLQEDTVSTQPEKKGYRILISDDDQEIHQVTELLLKSFTMEGKGLVIGHAYSGKETLAYLKKHPDTAMVLLDVVMEDTHTGLEVVRRIRKELRNRRIRIVIRTGQPGVAPEHEVIKEYDINDYRLKTEMTVDRLYSTVYTALRSYRDIMDLHIHKMGMEEILYALGRAAESHSDETGSHNRRVGKMMHAFAIGLGYSESEAQMIKIASTMHDIGKISIPDVVLKKPGRLTEEEFEVMKMHTVEGQRILGRAGVPIIHLASKIATLHHERYDGQGYPNGMNGEDIPVEARMMAIIDTYDAMTHKRVYKEAASVEEALEEIEKGAGSQFDPDLAKLFVENYRLIVWGCTDVYEYTLK